MIRWAGAIMILIAACGLGMKRKKALMTRVREIGELVEFLQLMCGQIRYQKASLPDALRSVEKKVSLILRVSIHSFFQMQKKREGESFEVLFMECFGEQLRKGSMKEEDLLLFFEFIKSGSFQDRQAQILKMEQLMGQLQKRRNYLEKEAYTGGKVALTLGSMLGIITVVALI